MGVASVAHVSSTSAAETSGEPSVFESTPAPSSAAMRCSEKVVAENAGNCTFESCPAKSSAAVTWETQVTEATDGQSVFENQPKQSGAHADLVRRETAVIPSTRQMTRRMRHEAVHAS